MTRKLIIGSREFQHRKLKEAQKTGDEFVLRREFHAEIASVEGDDRSKDFIISSDAVDRYGDTVAVDGWVLNNFKKNPVVLWMHDNSQIPVGKASNVRVEGGTLKARVTFTPRGLDEFNDKVVELLNGGFLNATSVGFLPLKYSFVDDPARRFGIDFEEQELLEFSIVTVPANPEALGEGKSAPVTDDTAPEVPEVPEATQETVEEIPEADGAGSVELAHARLHLARLT